MNSTRDQPIRGEGDRSQTIDVYTQTVIMYDPLAGDEPNSQRLAFLEQQNAEQHAKIVELTSALSELTGMISELEALNEDTAMIQARLEGHSRSSSSSAQSSHEEWQPSHSNSSENVEEIDDIIEDDEDNCALPEVEFVSGRNAEPTVHVSHLIIQDGVLVVEEADGDIPDARPTVEDPEPALQNSEIIEIEPVQVVASTSGTQNNGEGSSNTQPTNSQSQENIVIGPNGTTLSANFVRILDWDCYTLTTRLILVEVFGRETLATHTLSGKPPTIFKDRDAKAPLDPLKIQDIVYFVTTNTDANEANVRAVITAKCADSTRKKHPSGSSTRFNASGHKNEHQNGHQNENQNGHQNENQNGNQDVGHRDRRQNGHPNGRRQRRQNRNQNDGHRNRRQNGHSNGHQNGNQNGQLAKSL
uniref:BEN domain-containing protein n=2 Tax=Lutzomyia longipalpis TaxID=7200 RepID=A0A1B0CRC2_LUTLO